MKTRKLLYLSTIMLLLLGISLIGCEVMNMKRKAIKASLPSFAEQVESGDLTGTRLTIYYADKYVMHVMPLSVDRLKTAFGYKIEVSGTQLTQHRDLIKQMLDTELVPVNLDSYLNARIYYVFETVYGDELFSVCMWSSFGSIYVNGIEAKSSSIYFDVIRPFLPPDVSRELTRHFSNN